MTAAPPSATDPWRRRAACTDPFAYPDPWLMDINIFFPRRSTGGIAAPAKNICRSCEVQLQCLATGLKEPSGVWGGLCEKERRVAVKLLEEGWSLDDAHARLTSRPARKRGRKWPPAVSPLRMQIERAWEQSSAA